MTKKNPTPKNPWFDPKVEPSPPVRDLPRAGARLTGQTPDTDMVVTLSDHQLGNKK